MFRILFRFHRRFRFSAAFNCDKFTQRSQGSIIQNYCPHSNNNHNTNVWMKYAVFAPFFYTIDEVLNYSDNGNGGTGDNASSMFFKAAKRGDVSELLRILDQNKNLNVDTRHVFGWTPLLTAVVNGHFELCKVLLEAGANPNLSDEFSDINRMAYELRLSPAQVSKFREMEFCEKLSNRMGYLGFTPLHYAVLIKNYRIIKLLIEHGANPNLVNNLMHTPMDYATDDLMRKFLTDCEAKYKVLEKERELEKRRKFPIEQRLKQYIVGQEGAISIVSSTIRRKENGWTDEKHPLVFLFLGSSGIGKTELAKQLASYIHKTDKNSFIRLDMSEYQEKHEVAKLIGAPPGYVGHEEGGQLTKMLKQCKNAVVLFDEVDKAHPDVLTVLLQLFDEGRLTDGKGKTIECTDAIFIMTSNLASDEIAQHALELRDETNKIMSFNKSKNNQEEPIEISRKFKDNVVKPILKHHFRRDEFLGRINEIVYFLPFSKNELLELVRKELQIWAARREIKKSLKNITEIKALEKHNITLKWDHKVEAMLTNGYDVNYGARSIKYEVERRVINLLAEYFEKGEIHDRTTVEITVNDNQSKIVLKVNNMNPNSLLKNIHGIFYRS